ncbi:hypothetical protein [Streptococcus sp. Marseille-Q8145]
MTLNDKEIQELQGMIKKELGATEGTVFQIPNQDKYYQIVYRQNSTTQAMAVVPVDNEKGENPNYQETAIVVAGTQVPGENFKDFGNQPYYWKKNRDIVDSSEKAFFASGSFGIFPGMLTPQSDDIDVFYQITEEKIKSHNGIISNMSGHSQAGPGVAYTASKYGLKQNRTIKVTNFMDFAAKKAVDTGGISKEQVAYLNKNATIYRDSRGDVVFLDGNSGYVPYGQTMRFEVLEGEDGHSPRTPVMKGNKLDVDYYYKRNLFATGMTEKQVRKIAEYKAKTYKVNVAIANYGLEMDKVTPEYYVREYLKEYGDFAPEPSKQELLTLKRRRIDELHASLKTTTGSQMIRLREELVRTSAQTAQLQAEVYEQAIKDKLANAKESVSQHITELRSAAYTLAHNLSGGEIEGLLSELSFELAWNTGIEAATLSSANSYQKEMTSIAGKLNKAADRIVEIDQKGSQIFGEL